MAHHKITVTFRDYMGKHATMVLNNGTSLEDAKEFADSMSTYSHAQVISYSHTETEYDEYDYTGGYTSTGLTEHYDRCEQKCALYYRDADSGKIISVQIPAPTDACFDAHQNAASDVAEDVADAIARSSTSESINLIYLGGGLRSRLPKQKVARMTGA
jgi:hypothetical protein